MFSPIQKALVTGASSGIGHALSLRLARHGVEVWVAARRIDALEALVAQIRERGGIAHALALDIQRGDETFETLSKLDRDVGGIDLVVANAGFAGGEAARPLTRQSWSTVKAIAEVNLIGSMATIQPFLSGMLQRKFGQIVGISSLAADLPAPRMGAYGASKIGLSYYLRALDIELRPQNVFVTDVHPGFIKTPALDGMKEYLPFMLQTDEAIDEIVNAIRKRSRVVRFPRALSTAIDVVNLLPTAISSPLIAKTMSSKRSSTP